MLFLIAATFYLTLPRQASTPAPFPATFIGPMLYQDDVLAEPLPISGDYSSLMSARRSVFDFTTATV